MKNPIPLIQNFKLSELFTRWRKDPWPKPTGLHQAVPADDSRKAEHIAAKEKWEAEGGAVKPPLVDGPKHPL